MRRIAYGLLIFLGVILTTALVLPFFLNVNDYKPQIVAQATKALGRDVLIDGNISLSLLPSPQLTIDKVHVANISGGTSKDFLFVERVNVSVNILPLLKKHLEINSLDLKQPEIYLEKLKDGQTNWTFAPSSSSPSEASTSPSSPPSNFVVNFDKIKVTNGRVTYHTTDQEINVHNIDTHIKIANLKGPFSFDGSLKTFDQNVKFDGKLGVLEDAQDVSLKIEIDEASSTLQGKFNPSTFSFKGHLNATADPKKFKKVALQAIPSPLLSGVLGLDADVVANTEGISLKKSQFEVGSAHPTGDLIISFKNGLQVEGTLSNLPGLTECSFRVLPSPEGLKGTVKANLSRTAELLNWLAIETSSFPPELLGAITFSTNYNISEALHLHNLSLMIADAKLVGDMTWQKQKNVQSLIVDVETPKVENIFKLLGVKDPKHLGVSKLKGQLQIDAKTVNLTHLKGQLGPNIPFSGDVTIDQKTAKPFIKAALSLNSINVDVLLASRQNKNSPFTEGEIYLISTKGAHRQSTAGTRWSHSPLDFTFLEKFDGQFEITSSQLSHKDIVVTHPKLLAKVQNGRLDVSSLSGSIYGGMFRASGHLTAENALHFHILLQDANLKQLITQGSTIKIVAGKLTLSSDFSTHGKSVSDMIHHLSGPVNITAKDGIISGFDLPTVSQQLGKLNNIQSVLGLLNTSMGKGQTPFSSFKGDIIFREGVGKIESMSLIAQGGQGQATGQIDLPLYTLNVQADFHLTEHPKIPPFHMALSGPIDNPSRKLDTSVLQKYLMENVFKGVIEKLGKGKLKPADMLGSLLGGGGSPSNNNEPQNPQPQQSPMTAKPEKIVKDIFKGIF